MKRAYSKKPKTTRRGVASLYVVIFATILFGVVALSCVRIMLSEFSQSGDDDLSRSAYDAAMAGVEDAKAVVNRYYSCLSGAGNSADCTPDARSKLFQTDCEDSIGIARYLYPSYSGSVENPEVLIQEGSAENNSDQAYTCVIVSDVVPDYRGTLTSDTRTKVVPLGVKSNDRSSNLSAVRKIRFSWFSRLNEGTTGGANDFKLSSDGKLGDANNATLPPTVSLTLIRVRGSVSPDDFHEANNNSDYSTVLLLPSSQTEGSTYIPSNNITEADLRNAGNVSVDRHTPKTVTCSTTAEFACSVDLTGMSFTNDDSVFLVVSLPYSETITDFAVALYGNDETRVIDFKGVQISVDSTGRTNQLFRRVETRLDPSDLYFPYPQYALELSGNGGEVLKKNFWITANCWYSQPNTGDGAAKTCNNNGDL